MKKIDNCIIKAILVKETELALLLDCEGDIEWFSKSLVTFNKDKNELDCPRWLLKQKFPKEDWS
jgi:hypothetical protein